MTQADLEHFREILTERKENLDSWLQSASAASQDDLIKAQSLLGQIVAAVQRIEDQSYGTCRVCNGDVEMFRLEVQPVSEVCLTCISPAERQQLEDELFLASKVHRALLPQTIAKIEGFDVAVRSLAAGYVGGDYYDFLGPNGSNMSRVVIGDVMGKGIPAGLLMSNIQGAIRILAEDIASPAVLMARLNRWLCRNVPITKFISLACLAIEPGSARESKVIFANAGHCHPLLVRAGGDVEQLESTGGILGVHEEFTYVEHSRTMTSGDTLVLYTDGALELESPAGEMFGEERLLSFMSRKVRSAPLQLLDEFLETLRAFCGKTNISDDITLICLKKLG